MGITTRKQVSKDTPADLFQIAEVVREGRHIVLPAIPEPMDTMVASNLLRRLAEQEAEEVALSAEFATTPYAGAYALYRTLERLYGFVINRPSPSFFGPQPPASVQVQIDYDQHVEIIWGKFEIPGTSIVLEPGVAGNNNIAVFRLSGVCARKDQPLAEQLFAEIRKEISTAGIYRGKAITLKQQGSKLDLKGPDAIRFLKVDAGLRDGLILNAHTKDAVEIELMTPVEHREFAKTMWGVSMNRTVLLSGPYGTGKSMTGAALAGVVAANGGTYILLNNVSALPQALDLVHLLRIPQAVIFAEDVDRVLGGDRDGNKDTLLNLISGVQSATTEVMVVLTTNDIEAIHPAMIRRFQAVIEYTNPEAATVEALLRHYGAGRVEGSVSKAAALLAGTMPSLIKDTVASASLAAIRDKRTVLNDDDLCWAARQLDTRKRLATRTVEPEPISVALAAVGHAMQNGQADTLEFMANKIDDIAEIVNNLSS